MNSIIKQVNPTPKEHFRPEQLSELGRFIDRVRRIPYLRPDWNPKKEWVLFYAPTWGEAWQRAKEGLAERDKPIPGQYFQATLENLDLYCANHDARLFSPVSNEFFDNTAWCACYIAQEAVKEATKSWEWNKKRFDKIAEEDIVIHPRFGSEQKRLKAALIALQEFILEGAGNETARESVMEAASEDAWLMARLILTEEHPMFFRRRMHIKHASERMEVWEKGYGLAGDSCGVLYVYCRGRSPEEQLLR
jgi:RES domain-containing protein